MRRPIGLFTACLVAVLPATASAQSLKYTSVNEIELGGALGAMMRMMPGVSGKSESTTYIQGSRIRTDTDKTSTIVDWSTGKMIFLDHEARTYSTIDFATMAQQMGQAMGQAQASAAKEEGKEPATEQPKIEWEVHFDADRTGDHEKIDGYDAERTILTTEVIAKGVPEGSTVEEKAGMAIVSELWLSKDFPEYEMMRKMQGEAADRMREQTQGMASSMQALSSSQPGLADAWKKNAEELAKLEGYPVRSTMLFVTLPPDVALDREAALAAKEGNLGTGVGAAAGNAAAESAADAAKKALGGLAGRFGRGKKEEPKPAAEAAATPQQVVFMRSKSEVQDVSTGAIDPSVFEVPAGYTERPMGGPVGR